MSEHTEITVDQIRAINARAMHVNEQDEELQAMRDEVARLRTALEQAGDAICSKYCGAGPCHKKCMAVKAALTPQAGKGGGA